MIDLIEYIVAELKSKRLSRAHAASLVKQLSQRQPAFGTGELHPLVQQNTSDLTEQRYSSVFFGTEFFLADHKVLSAQGEAAPVLPAVAYLEMARTAVEKANPKEADDYVLELEDIAWAQPILVNEKTTVHLAVLPAEPVHQPAVGFEVYTSRDGGDVVHCQGRAIWRPAQKVSPLDLTALQSRMQRKSLSSAELYARFAAVGLFYGEGFRTVEGLERGNGELLATLRLPALTAAPSAACVLPPAMLDGALQAAVGLLADSGSTELRLPFALEKLRVLHPCVSEMLAWVRFTVGSHANEAVAKVDLDLSDRDGKICVQMRGFCSRLAGRPANAGGEDGAGILLASPEWIERGLPTNPERHGSASSIPAKHNVLLCGLPEMDASALQALLPDSLCEVISRAEESSLAERYTAYAVGCFALLRNTLSKSPGKSFSVQLIVPGHDDEEVLAGLTGLLRTAALENPQISGTVILLDGLFSIEQLGGILLDERHYGREMIVRYVRNSLSDGLVTRQVLVWKELASSQAPPLVPVRNVFRDQGTYVITGGLGGLGLLFAREILEQTSTARVILTGRSLLTEEKAASLQTLLRDENRVAYRQLDLADRASVEASFQAIRADFGPIVGVLHSAGMVVTNYILNKEVAEFREVLEPKVTGLELLDSATRHDPLEFFIMFSSLGALGNMGMADYAAGNAFMDRFAAVRNRRVAEGVRHGATRSINWPLWAEGGMGFDVAMQQVVGLSTGLHDTAGGAAMGTFYRMVSHVAERLQLVPLQTAEAMSGFYLGLTLPCDQFAVLEGNIVTMRQALPYAMNGYPEEAAAELPHRTMELSNDLHEKTLRYLRRQLSSVLKVSTAKIDTSATLEEYGMDSILAMRLTNELEKDLGPLSRTLFFEYRTLNELTVHILEQHHEPLAILLGQPASLSAFGTPVPPPLTKDSEPDHLRRRPVRFRNLPVAPAALSRSHEPIAIIGLSGRYPEAPNIAAFWRNLRSGKDCITEVPPERWDWRDFLSEDRTQEGRHFSKWGGFITGVDEFDPLFFNVSPTDAVLIDPQERLFLQHAWMAMEDAGYTRAGLQTPSVGGLSADVGVYAGLMYSEYQLFGAEISLQERPLGVAGSAASVANRVSYTLNLHGPSMTVDTMCSASLTAIHLACQDLRLGKVSAAFAGGVNVSIHPNKYLCLSAGQFISSDGHCQSFGVGGDGYIPGEGVGVVLLKRLADAERDGDHIYGVIRGSTINHGGRTNGYSVPNPHAQTIAIQQALLDAQVQPRQISYIEAHGTGTRLGDPIEMGALERAFNAGGEMSRCLVGSVKSNIGHCESAAGIAGLTKVLLQMQHGEIVPSLHSAELNPYIDFARSPFVINQTLRRWEATIQNGLPLPRMAGISSFGAGGSNAHLIVEEYRSSELEATVAETPTIVAIVLSARTSSQLTQKACDLLAFVRDEATTASLPRLAFTLQQGREPMEERLGLTARSWPELEQKLEAFLAEQEVDELYRGQKRRGEEALNLFNIDADLQQMLEKWLRDGRLSRLLDLWVRGVELDWVRLYAGRTPLRISLPTYPFSRERFWLDTSHVRRGRANAVATSTLHPLLHRNVSDLREQCFASTFTGQEPFLADHGWKTDASGKASSSITSVLPAAAFLEMVRAAVEFSLPSESTNEMLSIRGTVWLQPLVVNGTANIRMVLLAEEDGSTLFRVERVDEQPALLLCEGHALWTCRSDTSHERSLADVRTAIANATGNMTLQADALYERFQEMGLVYGPSHRAIQTLTAGGGQVLAHLRLPAGQADAGWGLPPALLDGAFQACAMLIGTRNTDTAAFFSAPLVPVGLKHLVILNSCPPEIFAVVRQAEGVFESGNSHAADIDVCDTTGKVCVEIRGLLVRSLVPSSITALDAAPPPPAMGILFAAPAWRTESLPPAVRIDVFDEHHVFLCGLTHLSVEELTAALDSRTCVSRVGDDLHDLSDRYTACALGCFEQLKALLTLRTKKSLLVQVVVANDPEGLVLTALTALLQTAMLEEPSLRAQMLAVPGGVTASELKRTLLAESNGPLDMLVRYEGHQRNVLRWRELEDLEATAPPAYRDNGVYLVTGGLGGLGTLFAQNLLQNTEHARIILTGRSPLSQDQQIQLERWQKAERVAYRRVNLSICDEVDTLIASVLGEYGRLDGIFHSAGMTADSLLRNKSGIQFAEVLKPKVSGTTNLDAATASVHLDFLALFSSVAGAMGNSGQADYAAANAFMDRFAAFRNLQVAAGLRHGVTRSINWPLWQAGGMTMPAQAQEQIFRATGMMPLETANGLLALHRCLHGSDDQIMVVEGDLARMRQALTGATSATTLPAQKPIIATPSQGAKHTLGTGQRTALLRVAEDHLREQVADLFRIPTERIRPEVPFEEFGIDSVLVMKLTARLEQTFGVLSKTLLFEYQTLGALALFLVGAHHITLERLQAGSPSVQPPDRAGPAALPASTHIIPSRTGSRLSKTPKRSHDRQDIAIIGMAGRYPQADDLAAFWTNLRGGRDCVTGIPNNRWDHEPYFSADRKQPGKSYSRWGGFLEDVDRFDARFFNITPKEAELIDPQERLFLQTAWHTFEDAGYRKEQIAGQRVGVYVGVMWSHYELLGAETQGRGGSGIPSSSHSSIANRVSYFLNLQGPSLALDTMCSSSLTAIHLACEALRSGTVEAALAGGVNLTLHPYKYLSLSQGQFMASDGRCRSFGDGGDGYVPGEGVGAVLLKPLVAALRDGDRIHALIRGSSINHGGKTNGYTVPNPVAQGTLIREALRQAEVDPKTIGYIEAHGTGTSLGDPIEMTGLTMAFAPADGVTPPCAVGSVKSNIGHLEAAAGIAAVTKTVLQLEHRELVPSLHAETLNPHIDWERVPLRVQTGLAPWPAIDGQRRRAGVSSFGAGGSNAHLILEEFRPETPPSSISGSGEGESTTLQLVLLSAHDPEALVRYAETWRALCDQPVAPLLADMAYTSQVGRTALPVRLAILAHSQGQLKERLGQWLTATYQKGGALAAAVDGTFSGDSRRAVSSEYPFSPENADKNSSTDLLASVDLPRLAAAWVSGSGVDWSKMPHMERPKKVSIPLYPFARERYWVAPSWGISRDRLGPNASAPVLQSTPEAEKIIVGGFHPSAVLLATLDHLRRVVGEEIRLDPDRIGAEERLESLGLESVALQNIHAVLSRDLGELPQTLFYERGTLLNVAQFLLEEKRETLDRFFCQKADASALKSLDEKVLTRNPPEFESSHGEEAVEPIAIVGMHGAFAQSPDLETYWNHLRDGKDLVDLVPEDRWNAEALFDSDPDAAARGKIYCKWGGFLDGVDEFDAPFFRISHEEACSMDPQERIFLQSVWAALEDSGYTRERLIALYPVGRSAGVGVFVGVTNSTYQLWAAEERGRGKVTAASSLPWSIANRVSYFFDFSGPSIPVDTACSSSLVAVHLACESLRNGECSVSIAGGVNLYLHPTKYQQLCARHMLASQGRCRSYGAGDDGFVPGEGVGTLVLKRLRDAIEQGDHIHAVITGSGYDHGGRAHGYSAPNPSAQTRLIRRVLKTARVSPASINYVEGHGTGTQMGDGLEVAALTEAFVTDSKLQPSCALGSVKANIGHTEAAAGIAGLAKIVLQMRHKQLVPSLHARQPNPGIDFKKTPFTLQQELASWQPHNGEARRALINAFGAGGVNACVLIEEYRDSAAAPDCSTQPGFEDRPNIAVLSARSEVSLRAAAERLLDHLRRHPATSWASLCFTLQTGREAMEERLVIPADNTLDFTEQLEGWLLDRPARGLLRGSVPHPRPKQKLVQYQVEPVRLGAQWVAGEGIEWEVLYHSRPPITSLPTYPFAKEHYWFSSIATDEGHGIVQTPLHPLVAYNSSTLREISFTSVLSERSYLGSDHRIHASSVLPGAAFLEIACLAGTIAGEDRVLGLRDIVWIQPLIFRGAPALVRTALQMAGEDVDYIISTLDEVGETTIHSEGRLFFRESAFADRAGIQGITLAERLAMCTASQSGEHYYAEFAHRGFAYGPAFQPIREIHFGPGFALARMELPKTLEKDFDQYLLHPALLDGALQTAAGLLAEGEPSTPHVPFALDEIRLHRPLPRRCYSLAVFADTRDQSISSMHKFHLQLLSEGGELLVDFKNLYVRALDLGDEGHRRNESTAGNRSVVGTAIGREG